MVAQTQRSNVHKMKNPAQTREQTGCTPEDLLPLPLSVCLFSPFPSHSWLAGLPHSKADLRNTFRRPDGGVKGNRSSRYLPEQSAASRCQLIVSESWGSGGRVPALPEWKQISSFSHGLSRERTSELWNIIGQAQTGWGWRAGAGSPKNKCTFVKQRHNASHSYWWQKHSWQS